MANTKKNIKVRDLKPSKDAKGGGARGNTHGLQGAGLNSHGLNSHGLNTHGTQGASKNDKQHQGHGGSGHS